MKPGSVLRGLLGLLVLMSAMAGDREPATDSRSVKRLFAKPPREYASAPLWVWNDWLTEDQIRGTLRDLADQEVRQVFVHPRPGLMTPYLGDDWFRLWKVALREAARLDMNVWIYDENSYPSGFAGGWVPELMPESRGMGLVLQPATAPPRWDNDLVAVYDVGGSGARDVTAQVRDGTAAGSGSYLVGKVVRAGNSPWHGNRSYVNLLTPGVTEKFLEVTLGAYDRMVGDQYGKRIPGVFTDEPNIRPAGGFPWCPDLPEQFQKRWGYRLLDHLPALVREEGDWRRVRHNYYSTLNDLFIERWAKPFYEACDQRGLEFTGHYWDHEWPHCAGVPDNMAMAAWQHRPGIDTLMNQYAEHTHAQFGNVRYCREISSVANQLGRERTLVELYGAGGWDLRFEDMKRIADWLQVLGINTMDEHLSYVTLRGARKRDHPQSFSYHEPWWPAYHVHATYMTRLSAALSQGRQVNRILVLEPTTTAWMYQGNEPRLRELGDRFFQLLMSLEAAQVEYDLGCEEILARHGGVGQDAGLRPAWTSATTLRIGERGYSVVILPEDVESLNRPSRSLLEDFVVAGGQVIGLGPIPPRTDGQLDAAAGSSPTVQRRWQILDREALIPALEKLTETAEVRIARAAGDQGILFHHRRELEDGHLLFLVNSSLDHRSRGEVSTRLGAVERWDPYTGKILPQPFRKAPSGVVTDFDLPPSGSLLLFFSRAGRDPREAESTAIETIAARGALEIRRVGPNVLTLDYVDVRAGGESREAGYFYQANDWIWKRHGMERNPWDSAVQFRDELISKTFPPGSGFEADYRFTVRGAVPANLEIVIERPDLYSITCNGQPVKPVRDAWWLDRAFGRIPLAATAREGENVVTLRAQPFTLFHELEPAYVLGDFRLEPTDRGWVMGPDQPLQLGVAEAAETHGNHPDGTMWLSGGIGFQPGVEDRQPAVTFDLGGLMELGALHIWNYNEGHVRDLTSRGVATLRVRGSARADGGESTTLGEFPLRRANGRSAASEVFTLTPAPGAKVRYVTLIPLANHAGVAFPVVGSPPDNGFVGLGEVRFLDVQGHAIPGVTVSRCSGELASMRRTAAHLVDGSGLTRSRGLGWNEQGHPFYAEGVAYRQTFEITDRNGRYAVGLPSWYGAVARVQVNGREAGWITAPPWECDVTREIRPGANRVEVTVIGTLKNTLGPHHGGHALGSAWPGMFQNGPHPGPPAGVSYSTVAYGMFAPMHLVRRAP